MDYSWIWETFLIFVSGKIILRIGGRKSISQMTITQTIVMIGIGSLLIQPIAEKNVLVTLLVALEFTLLMVISEYLEIKFDAFETFSSGKAVIIIENGILNLKNMKKLRLTTDRLETRLRQNGVSSIEDVKTATIEVSGQIGYELKDDKKPITKEDFVTMMAEVTELKNLMKGYQNTKNKSNNNIFDEIQQKNHEGKAEP
ncbi:DUF421 domain-containing protein [Anaerocolumna sp. MB42-C2]|uniref:DUF421 domain-containing protein n=1 Tax=Anaerocolumna sp. MB42-C2 TaxID=3070997 RepID=UPI0027DFDC60|nr:DUF421 domain-containing protein [Anaerocolumna sp. MB42-C2]WMJ85859.1 DUF421 domain-containing protein [Anaerocolumna sp. MB42-C2]